MKKTIKKEVEEPKKASPPLKKEKTIIWKDNAPIKKQKYDTSKSSTTDGNEVNYSAMSRMRVERLSRKRKRIHPSRQPSRLLRANGKRG
jgi:hypothetical protein